MRREYVVEEQPRLLRLEDVRGEDVPSMHSASNQPHFFLSRKNKIMVSVARSFA
jgi:hypothetical protein